MTLVKIDLEKIRTAAGDIYRDISPDAVDAPTYAEILRDQERKALPEAVAELEKLAGKLTHGLTIHQIVDELDEQEERLQELGIPKSLWRGIRIRISGDEKKKRSYKYSYECVEAVLERRASHWYIVSLTRETCYPGSERKSGIVWPQDSAAIREKVLANIFPANGCF